MFPKKKGGKKVKTGDKLTFLLSPSYFEILGDWIEPLDELLYAGVFRTMFLGLCSFRPQIRLQRSQMTFLESTGAKQSLSGGVGMLLPRVFQLPQRPLLLSSSTSFLAPLSTLDPSSSLCSYLLILLLLCYCYIYLYNLSLLKHLKTLGFRTKQASGMRGAVSSSKLQVQITFFPRFLNYYDLDK